MELLDKQTYERTMYFVKVVSRLEIIIALCYGGLTNQPSIIIFLSRLSLKGRNLDFEILGVGSPFIGELYLMGPKSLFFTVVFFVWTF